MISGNIIRASFGSLWSSLTWAAATRLSVPSRIVQRTPGKPGWSRIAVRGAKFSVPDHAWWPHFARAWEKDTERVYREFVKPGDAVVDAGAWIGPTAMFACARGAARLLAIEPNPACRPYLDAIALSAQKLGTQVVVCDTGIDTTAGDREFGTPTPEIVASSMASLAGKGAQIRVAPLPDLLARHDFADATFMKIDIEGTEFAIASQLAALAGFQKLRIFLSVHPALTTDSVDKRALVDALSGFEVYDPQLNRLSQDTVTSRILSTERMPSWGTPYGNFFEILLIPR